MSILIPERHFNPNNPEFMDRPEADPDILRADLRNLRTINKYFGGLTVVREGVMDLLANIRDSKTVEILDLATGSADQAVALALLFRRLGRTVSITALDKNPVMLSVARERTMNFPEISIRQGDLAIRPFSDQQYDIVVCSLALHHFGWEDAVNIVKEMKHLSRVGLIVNELSRSFIGASTAWLYTHLTTRNPMTLHDSYQSVLRAFTRQELTRIALEAQLERFTVRVKPMFRLVLIARI